jgi:hypothetical protein
MKSVAILFAGFLLAGSAAYAQQLSAGSADLLTNVPQSSRTVTDWYKQNVYDPNNNKIGEIMDVLVEPSGQVTLLSWASADFLGPGKRTLPSSLTRSKRRQRTTRCI